MKILGIETSCDETGIAILKKQGEKIEILSNVVASQVKLHQKYGGVFPALARREHQRNLAPVLKRALLKANLLKIQNPKRQITNSKSETLEKILARDKAFFQITKKFLQRYKKPAVGAIAVTIGPGLEPCLWQGINFANALGLWWDLPIIPINHIEGHLLVNWLKPINKNPESQAPNPKKEFPLLALIVSGGHTQLILMKNFGKYKIIGETRDDAAGECFDKTARILGLGYPGGPAISVEAAKAKKMDTAKYNIKLPRPMFYSKDYDFSFSGLKTAVLYDFKKRSPQVKKSPQYISAMSAEIQQTIIDVLVKKTILATKDFHIKTIILGGGVAANQELRQQLKTKIEKYLPSADFHIPPISLCVDNGVMIALAGFYHLEENLIWQKIKANGNLKV